MKLKNKILFVLFIITLLFTAVNFDDLNSCHTTSEYQVWVCNTTVLYIWGGLTLALIFGTLFVTITEEILVEPKCQK